MYDLSPKHVTQLALEGRLTTEFGGLGSYHSAYSVPAIEDGAIARNTRLPRPKGIFLFHHSIVPFLLFSYFI